MKLLLLGSKNSKRATHMQKAAEHFHVPLSILEWDEYKAENVQEHFAGAVVKIDPPSFHTTDFSDMGDKIRVYQNQLHKLETMDCTFLNTPGAILATLDKRICKSRLQAEQIPSTKIFCEQIQNPEDLIEQMKKQRVFSIFIKPVIFSGAAGVTAFRIHPRSEKMTAYTSCFMVDGKLVNTKKLRCMENQKEILHLLNVLLSTDVIVEHWYPKSMLQGKSYDLRVVCQFGQIAYTVVRGSNGPITNLHLNNQAMKIEELNLKQDTWHEIEVVCENAMALFPGLSMAGIDILLEKNSGKPFIIEMNGQGDLIYQDIYHDNRIYKEQIQWMQRQTCT